MGTNVAVIDRSETPPAASVMLAPALMPTDMRSAMELAAFMAKAKLVPAALQGSPGDCLLVIEQAMRWEMSPFAVAQEVSVISGKLMYSGKLVAAVVNTLGQKRGLQGRLEYGYEGQGDGRTITVAGKIDGRRETVEVRLGNVKTANAQWQKQPDQQLAYHGTRVWARRYMPEVMLGIWSRRST
jgi:RecT family